jgi:putative transposase
MGSLRRECLNHVLIRDDKHVGQIVTEYTAYFNEERPHPGIDQRIPDYSEAPE